MTAEQFLELKKDELQRFKKLYSFAIEFSNKAHFLKGYGNLPYQAHLFDVEYVIVKFGYGEETVEGYENRIAARLHDIIEDSGYNYNDVKKIFGTNVAEMVYLCADYRGRNRKQRKPDAMYDEMRENPRAVIIKLADRIANVMYSIESGEMIDTYKKEHKHFRDILYTPGIGEEMWKCLELLLQPALITSN
jgi:(p)ppGpp synthase/HD superfamily hydrolase